jgi:uncharacterized protein (TIGR03437 family)
VTPFGLPTSGSVNLTVSYLGVPASHAIDTAPFRPGLFRTLEADGSATALALNQDGALNSPAHPAPVGSIVTLFPTGLGQTSPAGVDGQVPSNIASQYAASVQVTVNGVAGDVLYAGIAPGFAGLAQINVRIPQTKTGPVRVLMGGAPFNQPVNLWIQ